MASIVNLPNSTGKTPFELCDEQYFYCTNYEISTLAARDSLPAPLGYMQVGYTQLYFFQRLVLWNPAEDIYRKYPEMDERHWLKNKYCVIGDCSLIVHAPDRSFIFPDLTVAKNFMKSLPDSDPNSTFVVARMLSEVYWH